jgi:hypothetical protein
MPSARGRGLVHKAVWWRKIAADSRGKQYRGAGVQIQCRWTPARRHTRDPQGNRITCDVTLSADRQLQVGDFLWKGKLRNFEEPAEVFYVVSADEVDDGKGRRTHHGYLLARFRSSLPAQAA